MEIILRCELPDRRGALAAVAGVIAEAGGDIEAVEVVGTFDGRALDDFVVVLGSGAVQQLVDAIQSVADTRVVHVGPSRGHPGDAVTRLALGVQCILDGAMALDHGVEVLVGGLLRAQAIHFVHAADAPEESDTTLVVPFDGRCLVVQRDYRFTDAERDRVWSVLRVCEQVALVTRAS